MKSNTPPSDEAQQIKIDEFLAREAERKAAQAANLAAAQAAGAAFRPSALRRSRALAPIRQAHQLVRGT